MITVNGIRATAATIYVPQRGVWFADLDMGDDTALSGAVTISLGESGEFTMHGTVSDPESGSFGLQRRVRVLAGGGGWARPIAPRDYVNDAGVDAKTVAQDAATAAGEVLGAFAP